MASRRNPARNQTPVKVVSRAWGIMNVITDARRATKYHEECVWPYDDLTHGDAVLAAAVERELEANSVIIFMERWRSMLDQGDD